VQDHLRRISLAAQEIKRGRLSRRRNAELNEVAAEETVAPGYSEGVVVPRLQISDELAPSLEHEVSVGKRDARLAVEGIGIGAGVVLER
jgi:hypothetical protein